MVQNTEFYGGAANQERSWLKSVRRGASRACPQCGKHTLFSGYTTIAAKCSACGLDLSGHQADDAPPYLTILLVGHLTIPLAFATNQLFEPPIRLQFAIWLPFIMIAMFWLLPVTKGAVIGLQWAKRMHGFAEPGAAPQGELSADH